MLLVDSYAEMGYEGRDTRPLNVSDTRERPRVQWTEQKSVYEKQPLAIRV